MFVHHDQALVARIRSNDGSAFEALYREYSSGLLAFAYTHVQSRELAEDLVQELFLSLWKHRAHWVLTGTLRAYLFRALRNHISNWRRAAAVRPQASIRAIDGGDPRDTPDALDVMPAANRTDDEVRASDLLTAFQRALDVLGPRCRQTYLLVRQEGLSYAEAADVLGITIKAVERNMVRAVRALREALGEWRE